MAISQGRSASSFQQPAAKRTSRLSFHRNSLKKSMWEIAKLPFLASASLYWPYCTLDHPTFDPVNYFNWKPAQRIFTPMILYKLGWWIKRLSPWTSTWKTGLNVTLETPGFWMIDSPGRTQEPNASLSYPCFIRWFFLQILFIHISKPKFKEILIDQENVKGQRPEGKKIAIHTVLQIPQL